MEILYIEWEDSTSGQGWEYKNEITKPKNLKCKSVGFLVKETKNTLMLATSENKYQFGAIWTIPKGCIKERKILAKNT